MTLTSESNNANSGTFTFFDSLRKVVKLCGGHTTLNLSMGSTTHCVRSCAKYISVCVTVLNWIK